MTTLPWTVYQSKKVRKSLKKYKSDKPVLKKFRSAVKELSNEEDPTAIAYEKTDEGICIYRLTSSVRMVYWVDSATNTILLGALGDHKEIYGKG